MAPVQGWLIRPPQDAAAEMLAGPDVSPPSNLRAMLEGCGAAVDEVTGRLFVADGADVLRSAADVIDPAVASHSLALEVRLRDGQVMWVGMGWRGGAAAEGCGGAGKAAATFDEYVAGMWDGDGMKLS